MSPSIFVATFLCLFSSSSFAIPIHSKVNKLFGHAIKNGPLAANTEQTTFEHTCVTPPCTITQIHVPSVYPRGGDPWNWEGARLRFYIDNETVPSIDIFLRELASIGKLGAVGDSAQDGSPFGHELFGKTAASGGVYSTVRIPFGVSIKTTITNAPTAEKDGIFWFIIRGIEGLPVTLGGELTLPDQARLVLYRNANVTLTPQELLTIASVPANLSGALVNVFLDNNSTDFNFLEACVRFTPDGAAAPIFLSSGTEDFFLSASYFDEQKFANSQSGVTYLNKGNVAMYKTHESRDFVLWEQGMLLQWKNEESSSGAGACPTTWPWPPAADAVITAPLYKEETSLKSSVGPLITDTLVWMYVWPSNAAELTFSGVPASK